MANNPKLPPKLIQGRSDERQATELVNAMRNFLVTGDFGSGSGQFSTGFSSNILGSSSGTEELVGQVDTPSVLASFTLLFGCQETSATGPGVIRVRFGGADSVADGDILMTLTAPAAGTFTRVEFAAPAAYVNGSGYTRLKLTLQSPAAGQYLKVSGMSVVLV